MRCTKMTFETKEDALQEIKEQKSLHIHFSKKYSGSKKNNKKSYPYLCSNCNRWHLTTLKQKAHKRYTKNGK